MIKCDKTINLRINGDDLEEFKKYAGKNYQVTIKNIMREYIDKKKKLEIIFEEEENKRNMYRK